MGFTKGTTRAWNDARQREGNPAECRIKKSGKGRGAEATHERKTARCVKAQAGPFPAGQGHAEPPAAFPAARRARTRNPATKMASASRSNPVAEPEPGWKPHGRCRPPRRGRCPYPNHPPRRRGPCESSLLAATTRATRPAATGPAAKSSQLFSAIARGGCYRSDGLRSNYLLRACAASQLPTTITSCFRRDLLRGNRLRAALPSAVAVLVRAPPPLDTACWGVSS